MQYVDLQSVRIDPSWAFRVPAQLALRRMALPLGLVDGHLVVAMADTTDVRTAEAVSAAVGVPVRPVAAETEALRSELLRVYGDSRAAPASTRQDASGDPITVVERILRAAVLREASDIHFNPDASGMLVRMRIDGVIEDFVRLSPEVAPSVASRLKVLSSLDIAEKRAPQDGAFVWTAPAAPGGGVPHPMDIRVATLPVRHGERLTLRLLESGRERLTLDSLGMSESEKKRFRSVLARPHGLVLMTGPTGSGKTTTLYAAIRELLSSSPLNILTVEDPIEYEIDGVSQAQVDAGDKVSFARALRSLLRHDPDVVMIGEIRDETSLDTAIKAALTGHLVLTTLHTGDSVGAVTRLRNMGVENHLLASTLRLCAAQRLVRRLCPKCRKPVALDEAQAAAIGRRDLAGKNVWTASGCLSCAGKGYCGRTGIFEFFAPDAHLASLVASGADETALRGRLSESGEYTLLDAAVRKLLDGETDAGEIVKTFGVF